MLQDSPKLPDSIDNKDETIDDPTELEDIEASLTEYFGESQDEENEGKGDSPVVCSNLEISDNESTAKTSPDDSKNKYSENADSVNHIDNENEHSEKTDSENVDGSNNDNTDQTNDQSAVSSSVEEQTTVNETHGHLSCAKSTESSEDVESCTDHDAVSQIVQKEEMAQESVSDDEPAKRGSRSSSESRNVFEIFPIDESTPTDKECVANYVENNENAENTTCLTCPLVQEPTSVKTSVEEIVMPKRKPIFKSKATLSDLTEDNTADSADINDSVIQKAKEKYPELKELRVTLGVNSLTVPESVPVECVEKPSKTVSKNFIGKSLKQKVRDRKQVKKDRGLKKSCNTTSKTSKGLSQELKSLHEPSIHHKISAQYNSDRSKPLKKRTRHCVSAHAPVTKEATEKKTSANANHLSISKRTKSDQSKITNNKIRKDVKNMKENSLKVKTKKETSSVNSKEVTLKDEKDSTDSISEPELEKTTVVEKVEIQIELSSEKSDVVQESGPVSELSDKSESQNQKATIVKKYPERTCKARLSQCTGTGNKSSDQKKTKPDLKPVDLKKRDQSDKTEVQKEKESEEKADADKKLKKKRKRKVKPWSWGNEKKRSKPKLKFNSNVDVSTNELLTEQSGIENNCSRFPVSSENKDTDTSVKNSTCSTIDSTHMANNIPEELSEQDNKSKKVIKCRKTRMASLSSHADQTCDSVETNARSQDPENPAANEAGNSIVVADAAEIINPMIDNELEPDAHDDNFPHVSPDSGIQSLAGSPAGNESPNSVILANTELPSASKTNMDLPVSVLKQTALSTVVSVTCSDSTVCASSVGLVSTVYCATASASVSSFSVTTSIKSLTETTTVYSKSSPLSSVLLSTSTVVNSVKNDTAFSDKTNIAMKVSSKHDMDSQVPNAQSPSKKKNRAKFLHLHKASTLLQKGRLPTEEEKEQRLEDKFDYLNKHGTKTKISPCEDIDISHNSAVTKLCHESISDLDLIKETKKSSDFESKACTSSFLSTINVNDILQSEPEDETPNVETSLVNTELSPEVVQNVEIQRVIECEDEESYKSNKKKKKSKKKSKRKRSHSKSEEPPCKINKPKRDVIEQVQSTVEHRETNTNLETGDNTEICDNAELGGLSRHNQCTSVDNSSFTPHSESETFCQDIVNSLVAIVQDLNDSKQDCSESVHTDDTAPAIEGTFDVEADCASLKESLPEENKPVEHMFSHYEPISEPEDDDCNIVTDNVEIDTNAEDNLENEIDENLNAMESQEFEIKNVIDGIQTVIENWDNDDNHLDDSTEKDTLLPIDNETELTHTQPLQRKRGRPPKGTKKAKLPTLQKYRNKYFNLNKIKAKGAHQPIRTYQELMIKRGPGRPKGSKNKEKTNIVKIKRPRGRPKGALNKVNRIDHAVNAEDKLKTSTVNKVTESSNAILGHKEPAPSFTLMQWRESSVMRGMGEEKKKRGRPRKHPLPVEGKLPKKRGRPVLNKNKVHDGIGSGGSGVSKGRSELGGVRDGEVHVKKKPSQKKGLKLNKHKDTAGTLNSLISPARLDNDIEAEVQDYSGREIAQSISSHDSDTSGAGSNLCTKTSAIQLWMEMSKHRRKKNKKKLLHFKSKHKNIIDPVFNAEVDMLTGHFPRLSISPRGETYLKVRPGEVPLPSIFKIVRIDVKKKKKDKLFVFEKAKPLKPKNDELSTKDKIKLGRRISILGESFMDIDGSGDQKQCNLPPKKRHKMFSLGGPEDGKPEKRKVGRPRKQSSTIGHSQPEFAFGKLLHSHVVLCHLLLVVCQS